MSDDDDLGPTFRFLLTFFITAVLLTAGVIVGLILLVRALVLHV